MADEQFCLRWNNHQVTLVSLFDALLKDESLVDCTIGAEGQHLKAHRLILSACSPYFQSLLCQPLEMHPMILLKDVTFDNLKALMEYMYKGEVNITQDNLEAFLEVAKSLKIKGLADGSDDEEPAQTRVEKPPWKPPTAPTSSQLRAPPPQKIQPESKRISSQMDYNSDSSRSTSSSPTMGKRRRIQQKPSEDDSAFPNNDNTSKGFQSTPLVTKKVPTAPIAAAQMNVTMPSPILPKVSTPSVPSVKRRTSLVADSGSTSLVPETPLLEAKVEPMADLVIPKTEYSYDNNDDDIEDLTLDDDEEYDMSQAGPSHEDDTNQSFGQWDMSENQSGQNGNTFTGSLNTSGNNSQDFLHTNVCGDLSSKDSRQFICGKCGKKYTHKGHLTRHVKFECGHQKHFQCGVCNKSFTRKESLTIHERILHGLMIDLKNQSLKYNSN